jgi:hypothetical protein
VALVRVAAVAALEALVRMVRMEVGGSHSARFINRYLSAAVVQKIGINQLQVEAPSIWW